MSSTSAVNDQIRDAVDQVSELLAMGGGESTQGIAQQVMVQAVALAMQNAVAQQQQAYILRNAATTAAVTAILQSKPEEALALIHQTLPGEDVVSTLSGLRDLMDELTAAGDAKPTAARAGAQRDAPAPAHAARKRTNATGKREGKKA